MKVFKFFIVCNLFLSFANIGYGQIVTNIASFNKIEVFGRINVRLEKSDNDSIFIKSGAFDINKVKYSVEDSVLMIKLLSELPKSNKVNITIQFQELNSIRVGAGVIIYNRGTIESKYLKISAKSGSEVELLVNVDSLDVKVVEKAFVRLTGINNYMTLKTSTKGDFRSTDLTNKITIATLNGGSAEINVADYLDATVRHGASLKYAKQPTKIKKKEKLGGTIGLLEEL